LLAVCAAAESRTTFLIPLDKEASWRDMAFLAATPAACVANAGEPSLMALDDTCALGPEIRDYARRYRPERVVLLCDTPQAASFKDKAPFSTRRFDELPASSAEDASVALSKAIWKTSKAAVICGSEDYESALLGSSVAALLKAPLLFSGELGLSKATAVELKRLGAEQLISIGLSGPPLAGKVVSLEGPSQAMAWIRKRGLRVSYLAAVNPLDRDNFVIRKLSLAGAELAAGRNGMVAPLRFAVQWKQPFQSSTMTGPLPAGVPASVAPAKAGTIEIGEGKFPFVLTGSPQEQNLRLSIDLKGDGHYSGPYASGEQVVLGGKRWAVSLGTRTGFGKSDVHLTWPTAERLCTELRGYYRALGTPPANLCLVGFPDALPQAIIGRGGVVEEQASDLPFAFADDGTFATIGVGRVIAENVSFGTLYAARALTYRELLSPEWSGTACEAAWENTYRPLFENVGFAASYRHTADDMPWISPPVNGKGGTRAAGFSQDSPLARCAALAHSNHSWWRELGDTFGWESEVLMAPTVVESGGCGTACLDREPDYHSVVARLLRVGAVAFAGGSREEPAEAEPIREEFWNGVLAGETIGQAHRRALNSALLIILDQKEGPDGAYRYSANIRMQFGDPGLVMYVPSKPRSAPAQTAVSGDTVSVYAPAKWWPVKIVVPADWKNWAGKDLYVVRGAGAYAMSDWCDQGYDVEVTLVTAEFTTRRRVTAIQQVQTPVAPLGWKGTWYGTDNADGSHTYRFAVRMIDFDQKKGQAVNSVDRLDYRLTFE
jgi:hypothetical protein